MYKHKSLSKYLDDLSAKLAAPGGGSAAAYCAALGAALVSMVINFTLGKPRYVAVENELKTLLKKSEKLRSEFLELTDLDVVAYKSGNLRDALDVPFMTAKLCFEGAKLCLPLVKKGNVNLVSDVAVAAVFFEAGFSSACFNVDINLKNLKDERLSKAIRKELALKAKKIRQIRLQTEEQVGKIIGR